MQEKELAPDRELMQLHKQIRLDRIPRILRLLKSEDAPPLQDTFERSFCHLVGWEYPMKYELNPGFITHFLNFFSSSLLVQENEKYIHLEIDLKRHIEKWNSFPFIGQNLASRLLDISQDYSTTFPYFLRDDLSETRFAFFLTETSAFSKKTHPFFWKIYQLTKEKRARGIQKEYSLAKNSFVQADVLQAITDEVLSTEDQTHFDESLKYVLINPNTTQKIYDQIFDFITKSPESAIRFLESAHLNAPDFIPLAEALGSNRNMTGEQQNQFFAILQTLNLEKSFGKRDGYVGLIKNPKLASEVLLKIKEDLSSLNSFDQQVIEQARIGFLPILPDQLTDLLASGENLKQVVRNQVSRFSVGQFREILTAAMKIEDKNQQVGILTQLTLNPTFPVSLRKDIYQISKSFENTKHRYRLLFALFISN
jgi:hypothetical protein